MATAGEGVPAGKVTPSEEDVVNRIFEESLARNPTNS
jgi:hypothetical protein